MYGTPRNVATSYVSTGWRNCPFTFTLCKCASGGEPVPPPCGTGEGKQSLLPMLVGTRIEKPSLYIVLLCTRVGKPSLHLVLVRTRVGMPSLCLVLACTGLGTNAGRWGETGKRENRGHSGKMEGNWWRKAQKYLVVHPSGKNLAKTNTNLSPRFSPASLKNEKARVQVFAASYASSISNRKLSR